MFADKYLKIRDICEAFVLLVLKNKSSNIFKCPKYPRLK